MADLRGSLNDASDRARILRVVREMWGFDRLRPLQEAAIEAGLSARDSLVVLPTGGGKSLCYQVPPLITGRLDVVVSPLISLMKDQVDSLRQGGYPAAAVHSGIAAEERREVNQRLAEGSLRLLFIAPERLASGHWVDVLARRGVRAFAVDEAHCISHWGHDFRPDYRRLASLRDRFPDASLHAFTATATERVRQDIIDQLQLRNPLVLVGGFDRPNLIYRILPQIDVQRQVLDAVNRHKGEAAIVYCLSRNDTEVMAEFLRGQQVSAAAYHAGMSAGERRNVQEAFAQEKLDVVVATVAFGMGIDRSNVRLVAHATMPKSIEHYQQETGRAGRDGLEAECVLFYTARDAIRWESLLVRSTENADDGDAVLVSQLELLKQMQRFCSAPLCRHRQLTEYFGQEYEPDDCGACDVCLHEIEGLADSTVLAQKILSCVARTGQRFGVGHVVDVLHGADTDRIRQLRHQQLSTYGLLKEHKKKTLTRYVYQLIDQGLLDRSPGEMPTLQLNDASWQVMRGQRDVLLTQPKSELRAKARSQEQSWQNMDEGLFESLRELRRELASEQGVPPYVVMHDRTLRQLASRRPSSAAQLQHVPGIGARRAEVYGQALIELIHRYCVEHDLAMDRGTDDVPAPRAKTSTDSKKPSASRLKAWELFDQGASVEEVSTATQRALSTTWQYLVEWIHRHRPGDIDPWVDRATYQRIVTAADSQGGRYGALYESLDRQVSYEHIRLVMAHRAMLDALHGGENE